MSQSRDKLKSFVFGLESGYSQPALTPLLVLSYNESPQSYDLHWQLTPKQGFFAMIS